MESKSCEVAVERGRRDSFVTASQSYISSTLTPLYHGRTPAVVPLRLTRGDDKDVYVGCLTQRPHREQKMKLLCSVALMSDLGLKPGEQVTCVPVTRTLQATKVLVAPLTVDDSEVVEQNAIRIEMELLQQVQVVFPRQVITVVIHEGVHAKVQVQHIECGEGNELAEGSGCALMNDGTHFVVATRARELVEDKGAEAAEDGAPPRKCTWSLLRGLPCGEQEKVWIAKQGEDSKKGHHPSASLTTPLQCLLVDARTATRLGWTTDRLYRVLDMATLAGLEKPEITPTFLRSDAVTLARLLIRPEAAEGEDGGDGDTAAAWLPQLTQATNVLVLPNADKEPQQPPATATATATAAAEGAGGEACVTALPPAAVDDDVLGLTELEAVHGDVPSELLDYLRFAFRLQRRGRRGGREKEVQHLSHNVLLCGGKGYGKTTIVRSVLRHLRGQVHSVTLECVSGKHFLSKLRGALLECALCAPSVLVLDGFDRIAADQKEGNVQAMSAATKATLEAVVTTLTRVFSFAGAHSHAAGGSVVVVGTCASRESVHEAFRSSWCFQKVLAVNALTRVSRRVLLSQLFPAASRGEVNRMVALMDNYTPFDVRQVAARIHSAMAVAVAAAAAATLPSQHPDQQPQRSLVECAESVVSSFTPLAHTGIKFLKGDKQDWNRIGGLTEAKKLLYDTLVLPMRHPKLFARLPLKTRSGVLLYGASGCGKTFVIESLVKAENLNCIVVNGPEVFGKYIGQSEQKIRDVFERAAAAAPCVVFFDEFDSVAPQRGVDNSGVTDRVVNQLLCYLDGVEGRKDVYVVAASSRPDLIDAALLRPGRLDKAVQCPVPSRADRVAILKHVLSNTPSASDVPDSVVERLAESTENWTPADLTAVVSTASMLVNQRVMDKLSNDHDGSGSGEGRLRLGEEDTQAFFIAGVGAGVSRDKVVDALKVVLEGAEAGGAGERAASLLSENKMTEADLLKAMGTTRPSLSPKDIAKQERIHDLFSKGAPLPTPAPGTKLTFS